MLFDKEFEFKGKHATYCRFLKNDIGLFKTFREAYTVSAIIGFLNSTKGTKNLEEKVQPASILPSELAQKRVPLTFIYRLIMLLDENDCHELKDFQNRTFRDDADYIDHPEKIMANMEIFNSYALGGLEILYDKFNDCHSQKETVNALNEFISDFVDDNHFIINQ